MESVHPEWRFLHRNMINELHTAMELDMLDHSHPISIPVKHPDEISEIFDTISYLKGASIIRMMDHFLGRTTLRHGLSSYLQSLYVDQAVLSFPDETSSLARTFAGVTRRPHKTTCGTT